MILATADGVGQLLKGCRKKQHSYAPCEVFDFEIDLEMGTLSQMSPHSWN